MWLWPPGYLYVSVLYRRKLFLLDPDVGQKSKLKGDFRDALEALLVYCCYVTNHSAMFTLTEKDNIANNLSKRGTVISLTSCYMRVKNIWVFFQAGDFALFLLFLISTLQFGSNREKKNSAEVCFLNCLCIIMFQGSSGSVWVSCRMEWGR